MSENIQGKVYLVPAPLSEGVTDVIPSYVLDCIKDCEAFFVEDERTARRYLKSIWREMVIDNYTWFTIGKAEEEVRQQFKQTLKAGKNVAIISEAGCPAVADPASCW